MGNGYDAGKKTKGRKRHLIVDTNGNILNVLVHSAGIQDREGCKLLLKHFKVPKRLKKIFVDGGYTGKLIKYIKRKHNINLEVVKRSEAHKFVVLPKRWIVERTNAWLTQCKRLTRDYENKIINQESMIYLRMIQLNVRRVCG